ncbi:MAG TPA: tripartite tricarboxylate transporter TctB family protein [Candidatus Limnocylindria bacterium]|nr:tripartite tricarboxylate transporter TctB family protein [Candidatus Limnocylindria bacterium]
MPQLDFRRALKDVLAGAMFIAFGLAFAFGALDYAVGTPLNMGPGYMPLALGLVLAGLGVLVAIEGAIVGSDEPLGGVSWRALVLITAALMFFGLTVRGLGVAGALLGTSFLAALARRATSPLEALVIAAALTVVSVVIFIILLQLRLPLIGPWVPL